MKKFLLFTCTLTLILTSSKVHTQGLTGFLNFRDQFIVFDKGNFINLEHLPIQSFKTDKWGIAYIKSNGTLMVYTNGQEIELSNVVSGYQMTESLLVYHYNNHLFVFDDMEKQKLSMDAPHFKANAEVVAFYDRVDKIFKLYENGKIREVEDVLSSDPVNDYKVGDNILAYRDPYDYLNVYDNGNTERLMLIQGRPSYKADKNIVAYYDENTSAFNVYDNGKIHQLSYFMPQSYKVADNRVVYVDDTGDFILYENDRKETISNITPDEYYVEDSLIVYEEEGYLKCYFDRQVHNLENFIPEQMKMHFNTLAYIDERNFLKVFHKGENRTISYEPVKSFNTQWGVVWFSLGVNTNKVFYEGKVHE
ncbi:MAG: hypothetical protein ACLFPH_08610 [Bacteroidales bacterium]